MDRRGRVERWNVSLPTDRFWDPPPLPPQWWMPARAELKVAAPASRSNSNEHAKLEDYEEADCSSTPRLLVEMTDVGQTNNILVVFTHALQLVATHRGTSLASLVLSHGFEKQIAPYFDWRTAFRGWACILKRTEANAFRNGSRRVTLDATDAFFLPQHGQLADSGDPFFSSHVLAQLLLRPVRGLRNEVARFEAEYGGEYDGVHLRTFGNGGRSCGEDPRKSWITTEALECQSVRPDALRGGVMTGTATGAGGNGVQPAGRNGRNVSISDLCHMSEGYLEAYFASAGARKGERPLVIAHDGQFTTRVDQLKRGWRGVELGYRGPGSLFLDMLLLIRSRHFVGNPGSTVSHNVQNVRRRLVAWRSGSTSNMGGCSEGVLAGMAQVRAERNRAAFGRKHRAPGGQH